ncbi:MAG: FadR family transcriptional regulator [Synergistaceae bacterium]|jgi:GntR family transcriptional repressor for pyruvate dehydrogenase complex|nr:FadR family transcriptional regulator [Synergistaceae bacterium]
MEATIKGKKKYEKVVDTIKNSIAMGTFGYGDPLPPERKMIDDLGVSRSSLREAFSVLELMGLIESIPGKGRFVRRPKEIAGDSGTLPLEGSAVLELMEARRVLDPTIAAEAARKADPSDIAKMRRTLSLTMNDIEDIARRARSDFDFHVAIAEATHNFIYVNIVRMEFNLILATHEQIYSILEDKRAFVDEHEKLFDAILDHDAERASRTSANHIERIYRTLMRVIALQQA